MALAKTTQDHDEIRKWAEARGGKPAVVSATEGKDETGIIRLMFPNAPNHNDDALEEIGWEEWFEKFDDSGLELTYQEKTADGQTSDFNRLTYPAPDSAKGKALLKRTAGKKGAKKSVAKSVSTKVPAKKQTATKAAAKTAVRAPAKAATKTTAKSPAKAPTKAATKAPAKAPAKKPAAKNTAAKKTAAKKTASKKTATKSASRKSSPATPARNYPKPDGNGPNQVF